MVLRDRGFRALAASKSAASVIEVDEDEVNEATCFDYNFDEADVLVSLSHAVCGTASFDV